MSAILAFLGSTAFRAIWGETSAWFTKRQDAKLEIEKMKVQAQIDADQHARDQEAIKTQAELGVKTIMMKADADVSTEEAAAFTAAMARANAPSGIKWVDAWNGCIRPAFASTALLLWGLALYQAGFKLVEWDLSMIGAVAGYYFADRTLKKAGK